MPLSPLLRSNGDGMEDIRPLPSSEISREGIKCSKALAHKSEISVNRSNLLQTGEIPIPIKQKKLKFVPYEPYKAAVTPIIPEQNKFGQKSEKQGEKKVCSDNKIALKEAHIPFPLIFQTPILLHKKSHDSNGEPIPLLRVLREVSISDDATSSEDRDELMWRKEKISMQEEINKLKEDKKELEDQFKVQLQVNSELKKLLVASMGEDMQSRMQFLSEDKAKLAHDIAHYSQLLLEDHEELERLSIQCDIWRSKFLAISLMVDELAGWKALLSRKYEESLEALQWMLNEREEILYQVATTCSYLQQLQRAFEPISSQVPKVNKTANILQVVQLNKQLTEQVYSLLLGHSNTQSPNNEYKRLKKALSPAELFAQKVLANKDTMNRIHTVENESAKDGLSGLLHFPNKLCHYYTHASGKQPAAAWCGHCSGEVKVL